MKYYDFRFYSAEADYSFDEVCKDVKNIFETFQNHYPGIEFVDIAQGQDDRISVLIGSIFLPLDTLEGYVLDALVKAQKDFRRLHMMVIADGVMDSIFC